MQPVYIAKSATVAGTAAMAGEEEKDLRHVNEVTADGGNFYPLVVESFHYWTSSSLESLKTIAAKTTSRNRTTFSQAFNILMQQLSVRIWQYNARMINARINLDADFDFWDLPTIWNNIHLFLIMAISISYYTRDECLAAILSRGEAECPPR